MSSALGKATYEAYLQSFGIGDAPSWEEGLSPRSRSAWEAAALAARRAKEPVENTRELVLLSGMVEHVPDWRKFVSANQKKADCFFLGGHCECHGVSISRFDRSGKRFERGRYHEVSNPNIDPAFRKPYLSSTTVQEALLFTWDTRGPFGRPKEGDRVTSIGVDSLRTVMVASDGPIGCTSGDKDFQVRVYPHLITAMWLE